MVSVKPVTSFTLGRAQSTGKNKQTQNPQVFYAENSAAAARFLDLLAANNKAVISFGMNTAMQQGMVHPYGKFYEFEAFRPRLSNYAAFRLKTEAAARMKGVSAETNQYKWPKIDLINAWMVTAETAEFMSDGGMGQVAADLPMSFNNKYGPKGHKTTVITPLYNGQGKVVHRLEHGKDGFDYYYGKNSEVKIPLEYVGYVNVPIYDGSHDSNTGLRDNQVRVLKGRHKNTDIIFLDTSNNKAKNDKGLPIKNCNIFGITAGNFKLDPYTNNGTDPITRMSYFSKAVYETMKAAKQGKLDGIKPPNVAILNDWSAGTVAPLTKYMAATEADYGQIDHETGKYFDELPTIFIVHNAEHQGPSKGNDNLHRMSVFATLLQGFSADILSHAKTFDMPWQYKDYGLENSMMIHNDFNSMMCGVSLADRIVPVSENYGQELLKSDVKSKGLTPIFAERSRYHTMTPIMNGYTKSTIVPDEKNMNNILKQIRNDVNIDGYKIDLSNVELLPYEAADDRAFEIRNHNKNEIMSIFQKIVQREQSSQRKSLSPTRRYFIDEDALNIDISGIKDFKDVPVIGHVGRIDPQKGMDTIFWGTLYNLGLKAEKENIPKDRLPIVIMGGNISGPDTYNRLKEMKRQITDRFPDLGKRIIIFKGFLHTHLLVSAADMFAMPSVFEPCGLTQIEAMAKGCVPVTTSTGGLVDTVKDGIDGFRPPVHYDNDNKDKGIAVYGNANCGFYSNTDAYTDAFNRALDTFYNDKDKFREIQKNAMANDFSWDKDGGSIDKYFNLMKTGKMSA